MDRKRSTSHLGCDYEVKQTKLANGEKLTSIRAYTSHYHEDMVRQIEERMSVQTRPCDTPWLDAGAEKRYADEMKEPGLYGFIAASPLMSGLYTARACRPDEVVQSLRLARRICKWTKLDDRKLIRYLGCCRGSAKLALTCSLSTGDLETAVVRFWPDADLAGDQTEDTKSSSGSWVEIASQYCERSMGIHWGMKKHTVTADSTPEAELNSMHTGLKQEALPIAGLVEFLLERHAVL